jgi:hypothetical protein
MRILSPILISLCMLLVATNATTKEKKAGQPKDPQAMMELYTRLATPGEPHKLFATLVGSWTLKTQEWMEPGKPAVESTGSADMKMLLDGRFLHQELNGSMMGKPFSGIVINGYDNLRKKYVTAWMDNMGTGIFMMEGTASEDGKTITLKGKHEVPGGGYMTHRAVWKIVDSDHQIFEMYGAHHGGKERKMLDIVYTRKQ